MSENYARLSAFAYDPKDESHRRKLGKLLTRRIAQIIKSLGFKTKYAVGQSNGVDVKVWHNDVLVMVAEVKNFNIKSKLDYGTKERIINNLNEYPNSKKFLIYTQMGNEEILTDLETKGISTLKIGYQLMPRVFYNSLPKMFRTYREIDSKYTTSDLKYKLSTILQPIIEEVNTPTIVITAEQ